MMIVIISEENEAVFSMAPGEVDYYEHTAGFHITVPISAEMSPKSRLLVYYIREDGETIADSHEINVENCVDNEVSRLVSITNIQIRINLCRLDSEGLRVGTHY